MAWLARRFGLMGLCGYMGRILIVDLTTRTYEEVSLDESIYREYIGGYGLGVRILYERMRPNVDPLGPENILGFVVGTFVGTKSHGGGRFNVVTKSPLTGGWADSSCGGYFGPKLKRCGYDGLFITGSSEAPLYLWITDQGIECRDARHLWGKDTTETEDILRGELGRDVAVASIGQAGENLSKIAAIIHDYGRAAGRQGVGAVMGSKRLKAVAVKGSKEVPIADKSEHERILSIMRDDVKSMPRVCKSLRTYGSPVVFVKNVTIQDAPIQNWKGLSHEVYPIDKAQKLGPDVYLEFRKRRYACAQCVIGCGAILEIEDGNRRLVVHRPEYETIAAFGSMCLIDDIMTVIKANDLCNRYGFDTISAGTCIAFAMECYERGLITDKDTEGLKLNWGNQEAVIPLLELMSKREGFGAILADGVKVAAEKIGKGAEKFAMHVAGQEVACHDPRCWPGFGYGYVLDPTPGRHTTGGVGFIEHGWTDHTLEEHNYNLSRLVEERYSYTDKGWAVAVLNQWFQFFNSTGMCIYNVYGYKSYPILENFRAITGWYDFDLQAALLVGERINTLRHCFNLREGLKPQTWTLPARLRGVPPLPAGPTAGITLDIETVRKSYYEVLDWDIDTGRPSAQKLKKLGLDGVVGDLS
ncbi:aldehyde ferredoxin oxidoreductase family protein [Moorellaceae bacterium AZ2]